LLGLQFILRTTGGSLFLAASLAPALAFVAAVITASLLLYRFQRRHSLFLKEEYGPGEIIFRKGDSSECAYFILSGEAEVVTDERGKGIVIATLSSGEYFGEMALLSNQPRNATVRARTNLSVEVIGKDNFLTMLSTVRSAREDVTKTIEKRLGHTVR
jgi:CRP-like cAMP-binding protein